MLSPFIFILPARTARREGGVVERANPQASTMNTALFVSSHDRIGPSSSSSDHNVPSKWRDPLYLSSKFSLRDSGLFGTKIKPDPKKQEVVVEKECADPNPAEDKPEPSSPKTIVVDPTETEQVEEENKGPEIPTLFSEAIQLLKGVTTQEGSGGGNNKRGGGADQSIEATKASVEKKICEFINENHMSVLSSQEHGDDDKSEVDKLLFASNTVLTCILDVLQNVMATHPLQESFCLVQMVHQEFVNCIISTKIETICKEQLHELKPGDIGNLMSWMNHCAERWRQTHPVLSMMTKDDVIQTNVELLLNEYLVRGVEGPVRDMLENMQSAMSDDDVIENENGQLATYQPLDIAFMLEGQLSVAKDVLPPKYVHHVLATFNEQLRGMIGNVMLDIESSWKSMAVVRLCSVINDAAQLSEQCENRNEELLKENGSDEQVQAGHDLCKEFIELSLHAAKYLCERILLDLREPEPILTKVGESIWEEEEGSSMVASTIATLVDYFEDLEEWIPHYYFAKCLKHCFDLTLQTYIDSFFSNTMAKGLKDSKMASSALHYDSSALLTFFGTTLAEYHGRAGFYSKQVMEERLEILSCISKLLDTSNQPNESEDEIMTLFRLLGTDSGVPAVLHLAGLRKSHVDVTESSEWHVTISRVTQDLKEAEEMASTSAQYKVPDLRNSEYVTKVKPIVAKHDDDLNSMDATNRLVQRPGLNRNWSWRSFRTPNATNTANRNTNNNNLLSQQSRRNLLTQQSERNLNSTVNNNKARPGLSGFNKLYSTRFNYRSTRQLNAKQPDERDDADTRSSNEFEKGDLTSSSERTVPDENVVAETKPRVTFSDDPVSEARPRVTFMEPGDTEI